MRTLLRSPFVAALIGGVVVAVALLVLDVGDKDGATTTVVQQAPVASPSSESGDAAPAAEQGLTAHDIYERDAPGVVHVRAEQRSSGSSSPFGLDPGGEASGTGFLIDADGHILTNYHVVANASSVEVGFDDNRVVQARVLGTDATNDLALLRIDDTDGLKLAPLALGDSSTAQVGDPVLAIGNPFGLDRTLTTGVVSALQRQITAPNGFTIQHVIQTDASINPGNSGGPLLDAAGRVLGINSQIITGGTGNGNVGIGFAVPINTAKKLLPQLKQSGSVVHAYLGITGATIDASLDDLQLKVDEGVLVQTVTADGPAAKAGVHGGTIESQLGGARIMLGGDVIQSFDGRGVDSMSELMAEIAKHRPGDRIRLEILRSGDERQLSVTLGTAPRQAPSQTQSP